MSYNIKSMSYELKFTSYQKHELQHKELRVTKYNIKSNGYEL